MVTWEELVGLMHRFSQGEDFSFAKEKWELSFDGNNSRPSFFKFILVVIVILIAMAILIVKYS